MQTAKGNNKERQSNFELLRIISMLMVLGVHIDGASLGLPEPSGCWASLTARDTWQIVTESICIVGVNCFTMISGYFGIRLTSKSVFSYLFQCAFYAVGIYSLAMILRPESCSWRGWAESWLVLSHTDLWYVPAYFLLMLLSPFINAGLDKLSRQRYSILLAVLAAYNIWCGWWWHGNFNPTGYTIMQLILMYIAGGYIHRYVHDDCLCHVRLWVACGFVVSALAVSVSAVYLHPLQAFAYNSPFVMAESIFLFLLLSTIRFQSRVINRMARGAFAVYLIHKSPVIWGGVMKPAVIILWNSTPLWVFALSSAVLGIVVYTGASAIDMIRQRISSYLFRNVV